MSNTFFNLFTIYNDAPQPFQIGFQDSAAPGFTGIVELHNTIFFYLVFISVGVLWVIFSAFYFFKSTKSAIGYKYLNHGTLLELIWTVSPAFILISIAFPSFRLLYLLDEVISPTITIKVVGHQWYWSYEYSDYITESGDAIEFDSYMIPESDLELDQFKNLDVDLKSRDLSLYIRIKGLFINSWYPEYMNLEGTTEKILSPMDSWSSVHNSANHFMDNNALDRIKNLPDFRVGDTLPNVQDGFGTLKGIKLDEPYAFYQNGWIEVIPFCELPLSAHTKSVQIPRCELMLFDVKVLYERDSVHYNEMVNHLKSHYGPGDKYKATKLLEHLAKCKHQSIYYHANNGNLSHDFYLCCKSKNDVNHTNVMTGDI